MVNNMIKDFETYINEDYFSRLASRKDNEISRKEVGGKTIIYDGAKYQLSQEFLDLGDKFNFENFEDWRCFAFNKPKDGNVLRTEYDGTFGMDRFDLGDDENYDVYVLREFIEMSRQDIVGGMCRKVDIFPLKTQDANLYSQLKDVIKKYIEKLIDDNHLSELSYYNIYDFWSSDWGGDKEIYALTSYITTIDELYLNEGDAFYDCEGKAVCLTYPSIDGWKEELVDELTNVFSKFGWGIATSYALDPYDSPNATDAICFCKKNED